MAKEQQPAITFVEDLAAAQAEDAAPVPPVDPSALLTQIADVLRAYQAQGLVVQRADGSFLIPGLANPLQTEVDRQGSLCTCDRCTVYNQLHWRCVSCYRLFEWATQRPTAGWPLGTTGRGGLVYHAVCSQACGQAFLARHQIRPGTTTPAGVGSAGPPGIGESQVDFFLSGAET